MLIALFKEYSHSLRISAVVYYICVAFNSLALALPHAILTPLLFSKGLSLSEIATIQIGYSAAVFLLEIPSGVICDVFNRKNIYLLSQIVYICFLQ